MADLTVDQLIALPPACRDARKSLQDKRTEVRLFFWLVWAAGLLLLALLVYAGINALNAKAAEAILGTGAAIADGAALAFIVGKWREAEKNVRYWQRVVRQDCAGQPDAMADLPS